METSLKIKKTAFEHNWITVALVLSNILIYTAMVGFNILASIPSSKGGLFSNSVGGVSENVNLDVIPAGWVFGIVWTTIFIWNFIWLLYALACIFRHTNDKSILYLRLDFFHPTIFAAFIVNNLAIIIWLFLWTNSYLGWAFLAIVFTALSLHISLFVLLRKSYQLNEELIRYHLRIDIWLIRILPQNGLALFLTWLSLATSLNFGQFLGYSCGVDVQLAGTISLIIILFLFIGYFVIENFIWPQYLLYNVTPWVVVNLALVGAVAKNWISGSPSRNNIITLCLLILVFLLAIGKIVMFVLYMTKLKTRIRPYSHKHIHAHESGNENGGK